jgi:hypothetical protein
MFEESRDKIGAKDPGKDDVGKLDWNLMLWTGLEEVVKVRHAGVLKYEPHSWADAENPLPRYSAAAMRHLVQHMKGELNDPETGLLHVAHAACNMMFMLELMVNPVNESGPLERFLNPEGISPDPETVDWDKLERAE